MSGGEDASEGSLRIFISYRRGDAPGHAGRLYDGLVSRFGGDSVFMDVDAIKPGTMFSEVINEALVECYVVLVVIGTSWLASNDKFGKRRLDDPNDFVRIELVAAIRRRITIIPLLVQGAEMPSVSDLPEPLSELCRWQAVDISDSRWGSDINPVLDGLVMLLEQELLPHRHLNSGPRPSDVEHGRYNPEPSPVVENPGPPSNMLNDSGDPVPSDSAKQHGGGRRYVVLLSVLLVLAVVTLLARTIVRNRGANQSVAYTVPQTGECRGPVTQDILAASSDIRPTVPCDQPHGSETFFVNQLPRNVANLPFEQVQALRSDSAELSTRIKLCRAEFQAYVGVRRIGPDTFQSSNLIYAFFLPSRDDWARGARWIRCDAITKPFDGQAQRSTTERLRGIMTKNDPPAPWRLCYRDAPRKDFVEGLEIKGFTSCDQPHQMEDLLHFQVTNGDADALGSPREIGEYANREFSQLCIDRAAAQLGLSMPAFRERNDIVVYVGATSTQSWSSDPSTREVACLAVTEEPSVGTLEGLGNRPLPRP